MVTLLAVYDSDGCVGRCDARCYDATSPECECICGGANHGAGLNQAAENTREMVEEWLEDYRQKHDFDRVEVPEVQLSLFEESGPASSR